jgi:hypothetical protein
MTSYKNDLIIDFGEVGYVRSQEPFRVRLDSSKLSELMDDAANAYRVYELMLIERPGDVWDYVSVVVEVAPKRVTESIQYVREKEKNKWSSEYPWPADNVPFKVFDKIFYWAGDDTEPPDQAWRGHRDAPAMKTYAEQLLGFVRKAQKSLDWNDHLLRHIVSRVKSGNHPYDFLERKAAIAEHGRGKPRPPEHTEDFYKKLREVLREPDLVSIAYRANGDYKILQMLATEQRRRANRTQHSPDHAMHINAIVNHTTDNVAWDSTIHFFDEGLGHGDLFIQGHGMMGAPIKELVEVHRRTFPGRHILSIRDEGDIKGFSRTSGDGWFLYTSVKPNDRRMGLECIDWRRSPPMGAVLSFEHGATLFDHEKSLFFVGEDVDTPAREALAVLLADWETHSGDPVLVVMGDTQPFETQKCSGLFEIPTSLTSDEDKEQWLSDLIRLERPWMDAIIALDAPTWAVKELNWRAERTEVPWRPWVVTSSVKKDLKASYVVHGDLAKALRESHQRAKSTRSQTL